LGVVECGRVGQLDGFAPGVAGTAVIETKNDDASLGEAIGEITERLVCADCFVSILRARTRDQDHAREWAGSSRDRECSGEFEPGDRLREPNLSFVLGRFCVGVRGHGVVLQRRRLGVGARRVQEWTLRLSADGRLLGSGGRRRAACPCKQRDRTNSDTREAQTGAHFVAF
jgi:hypothetical protein